MPKAEICKTCQHFRQIQGLFGKCVKLNFKETEYVFAPNPACAQYEPKELNPREAPQRGNIELPWYAPFISEFFPTMPGAIPSVSRRFVQDKVKKPKEEKEEWVNPIFRRKHPVQKVIRIGAGADGKMRRMP